MRQRDPGASGGSSASWWRPKADGELTTGQTERPTQQPYIPPVQELATGDGTVTHRRALMARTTSSRQSAVWHARPIRPEDTALVERTTELLRALEQVHADATAELPSISASPAAPLTPVTLVAAGLPTMATLRRGAPPRHHRGFLAGLVACMLCVIAVATLLYAVRPAGAMGAPGQLRSV